MLIRASVDLSPFLVSEMARVLIERRAASAIDIALALITVAASAGTQGPSVACLLIPNGLSPCGSQPRGLLFFWPVSWLDLPILLGIQTAVCDVLQC